MQELIATVKRIVFQKPGWCILRVQLDSANGIACFKGDMGDGGPAEGGCYRFLGRWQEYNGEQQFAYKSFTPAAPIGNAGRVLYLQRVKGIGESLAGRLVREYDEDVLRVLEAEPDRAVMEIDRLTPEVADRASQYIRENRLLEETSCELLDLLKGRKFPRDTIKWLLRDFGNRAAHLLRRNPYLLMKYRGIGFRLADRMYLDLGLPPRARKRQFLCLYHYVESQAGGNTWVYWREAFQFLMGAISSDSPDWDKAIKIGYRSKWLASIHTDGYDGPIDPDGSDLWLSTGPKARGERHLAELVVEAMAGDTGSSRIRDSGEYETLSDHQREQLQQSLVGGICILGGSPGTGKTYTVARAIAAGQKAFGGDKVAVCAPTGKAAVRVTESMAAAGIKARARTIHSLLGVTRVDGAGWSFEHNESNKLPHRMIVVDESSMIDANLMLSLMKARDKGCLLVLVGDVNQLAPVGHGAPLRDMIEAGVPYGELREVRRNSGQIVKACAQMRDGEEFETGGNLVLPSQSPADGPVMRTIQSIHDASEDLNLHPVWECQVLVPLNETGDVHRKKVNQILQQQFNKNKRVHNSPFLVDDKIVCLSNSWLPQHRDTRDPNVIKNDDGKVYVANGEIAQVEEVHEKYWVVSLASPSRVVRAFRVDQEKDAKSSWDLAYALSCHKSQGSEWPFVAVILDESNGARRLCDRSWIYTAISRAKQRCALIGSLQTAHDMASRVGIDNRKTFLTELTIEKAQAAAGGVRRVPVLGQPAAASPALPDHGSLLPAP